MHHLLLFFFFSDIYGRFIEMSGGIGVAKVGIVTAASSDPEDSANFYQVST